MLKACSLLFRRGVPIKTRMMATASILCMLYFILMTFGMTSLAWNGILPNIFKNEKKRIVRHKLFILFVFANAVGNCILCLLTDTSVKRTRIKEDKIQKDNKTAMCATCNSIAPPRSHHCPLCETCILKRDHHCFFLTVCIGYHNQKYFIMYCFYMLIGTFYAMFIIVRYLKVFYSVVFYGPQTFIYLFFSTVLTFIKGEATDDLYVYMIFMMFGSLSAGLIAAGLWFWQIMLVFAGQSTFESCKSVWKYSSTRYQNFKDVFGKYWFLTFVVPIPLPQCSDGIDFSYLKKKH